MVKKFFYEESSRVQKDKKKDFASLSEIKRFGGQEEEGGGTRTVVVVLLLVVVAMIPQEYNCLNKFHKFPFGYYTCFNYKESINYNFYNNNNNNNSIGVGITFNSQKFKGFFISNRKFHYFTYSIINCLFTISSYSLCWFSN